MNQTATKSAGRKLGRVIRWIVAAVLVFLIVRYFRSNPSALTSIASLDGWRISLVILLYALAIGLHALRIFLIIGRHAAKPLSYGTWLRLFVEARVLNLIGSQLGNIYRARQLKRDFDVAYTSYASSFGFFIWLDTSANMAMTVVVLTYFTLIGSALPISAEEATVVFVLWLSALPAAALLIQRFDLARASNRFISHARRFFEEFRARAIDKKLIASVLGLGLLSFTNLVLITTLLFTGIGADAVVYQIVVIVVLYKLSIMLMLTPGNVGITEWTIAGACMLVGIDAGAGLLVALLMRAFNLVVLASMASLFALQKPRDQTP